MPVLLLILGLAVLVATVYVAMGHGGELSKERADYAPLDLGPVSAADVALLRPPSNGWGYNKEATDEALGRIAESVRERDVRIVALEQLVTDLSRAPGPAPSARLENGAPEKPEKPEKPAETTLPQRVMPPVVWPSAPAVSDAAAEETTQPQPAVREPSRQPEEQPQEPVEEQQDDRPAERQQQKPPPERSHG